MDTPTIIYARIVVSFHGLDYDRVEQVERLREEIEDLARSLHPDARSESDVEVELDEYAGHGL